MCDLVKLGHSRAQFTAAAGGLSDGLGGLPPIRKRGPDELGDSLGGLAGSCGWCGRSMGAVGLRSLLGGGGGVEDSVRGGGGGGAKGELEIVKLRN